MIYKKLFLSLAGLITLIAIVVNIFLYQKVSELSDKVALNEVIKEESTSQPVTDPVEQSPEKAVKDSNIDDEINELEYQLRTTEEEIDMVSDQLTEVLDDNNKGTTLKEVENRLMENEIKQSIDRDFALLYKRLALSPEDLEEFKRIELEFRLASEVTEPLTPDNWKELRKLRQEMKEKYNPEFIDLLGDEKFKVYDSFRESMQERNEVNGFMAGIGPENRISDDVAEKLIMGMYEARRTVTKELDLDGENTPDSWLPIFEALVQTHKKYEEAADNILPPDQAELFNTKRRWILEEYEEAKRMISSGMEAGKNKDEADVKRE